MCFPFCFPFNFPPFTLDSWGDGVATSPIAGHTNPSWESLSGRASLGKRETFGGGGCQDPRGARGVPNGREKFRISALLGDAGSGLSLLSIVSWKSDSLRACMSSTKREGPGNVAGFGVSGGHPVKADVRPFKLSNAGVFGSALSGSRSDLGPFSGLLAAIVTAPEVSFLGSWMSWHGFAENRSSRAENASSDAGVSGRGFSNRSGGSASGSDFISRAGTASDIFFAEQLGLGSVFARIRPLDEGEKPGLHFMTVNL